MWQVLAELLGSPHAGAGVDEPAARGEDVHTEYSLDFVAAEEIEWDLDPFKLSDTFRICCVLRMFDQALIYAIRVVCIRCAYATPYATYKRTDTFRICCVLRMFYQALHTLYIQATKVRIRDPIRYAYAH